MLPGPAFIVSGLIAMAGAALSSPASSPPPAMPGTVTLRGPSAHSADHIPSAFMIEYPLNVCQIQSPAEWLQLELRQMGLDTAALQLRTITNTRLFCGVSFSLGDMDIAKALNLTGLNLWKVRTIKGLQPASVGIRDHPDSGSQLASPESIHSFTGVADARALGYTGKGVKIAVIDSGVYYKHAALGGCFGPDCKIGFGYDFIGNVTESLGFPIFNPTSDPFDNCSPQSHGTHVAGIIAGNALNISASTEDPADIPFVPFSGVAPDATLGVYRVFGCMGESGNDVVTSAIYKAAEDGADIINLSLGNGPAFSSDANAMAVLKVAKQGVIVVAASGNDGASGVMAVSSPSISEGAIGIASFDNVLITRSILEVDGHIFPWTPSIMNRSFSEHDQVFDVVVNDMDADENNIMNDGSSPIKSHLNITGKAVLLRYGQVSSTIQCMNVFKAGGAACFIYSNSEASLSVRGFAKIPGLATSQEAGQAIISAIKAGKSPRVVVSRRQQNFQWATAGTVSSFSSGGLDPDLNMKPELAGIGGQVLSPISPTAAKFGGHVRNYGVYDGTSMASPYVCGVIALLMEAKGRDNLSIQSIRARLQNTARHTKIYGKDLIDSVAKQGAGLINAFAAITAKTVIMPSSLSLNDSVHLVQNHTIYITNQNNISTYYNLSSEGAAMITFYQPGDDIQQAQRNIKYSPDYATVKFIIPYHKPCPTDPHLSPNTIMIPAGKSRPVILQFTPPSTTNTSHLNPMYSGYITLSNPIEDHVFRVPYIGMLGDWASRHVFIRQSKTTRDWLLKANGIVAMDPNITASTGLYQDLSFESLEEGSRLNASAGGIILLGASITSRYARVELIYDGDDINVRERMKGHATGGGGGGAMIYVESALMLEEGAEDSGASGPLVMAPLQKSGISNAKGIRQPIVFAWRQGVVTFDSQATGLDGNMTFSAPAGRYRIKFMAVRNFGNMYTSIPDMDGGDSNWDVLLSKAFDLHY